MPGEHNVSNATAAVAVARAIGIGADDDPQGPGQLRRREAALHPDRRLERRRDLRRLRPPPGGDRRGAAAPRARRRKGRVIAVVQPHRYTRLKNLFAEFCTCFNEADTVDRRRRLSGRRGADRRREPRRAGRGPALRRPPRRARARERRGAAGARRLDRAARRHGRLPRRRLDHPLGECAAGGAEELARKSA